MRTSPWLVLLALGSQACLAAQPGGGLSGPYDDHEEMSDFALLRGGSFDRNDVMSNGFFTNTALLDGDGIQRLLEETPYGRRCFLADETIGGRRFADVLVDAARAEGMNPLLLLIRMQVEKSLLSQSTSPGGNRVDYAFGCGCPDGHSCNPAYRGLDRQVECGAHNHMRLYRASENGSGGWRAGVRKSSLDPLSVTPANHATAALYAYTPWVLQGSGGNWLVWNVTNRFVTQGIALGLFTEADLDSGTGSGGTGGTPTPPAPGWIGSACTTNSQCDMGLEGQMCHPTGQLCVSSCSGFCPDRTGHATTFCVSLDGGLSGTCVPKAASQNASCAALPNTESRSMARYVGSSGASAATATVCVPREAAPPSETPADPTPADPMPALCSDTCTYANDGECDDGGPGSTYSDCALGTDCGDCGSREAGASPEPAMSMGCSDTCTWARDGQCDDGGPGSVYSECEYGTDCADCGPR
ncbi:MAG: hypothetical protein AB7S26_29225 [Sandaracinaceae bacterium]